MISSQMTVQERKTLEKYLELLMGRHNEEGNLFLFERLPFGDNYNNGTGNRQIVKPLQIPDIITYIGERGSTHDFCIAPAIYKDTIRSYGTISGLYCFWAEFDFGTIGHKKSHLPFANKADCIRTIKNNYLSARLNPNVIMNSGHGIHCYWLIDSNLIGQQTKKQIEQVNEWLFQVGIGINRNYYNEVKSITSLMRAPYPAVNRKIADKPVKTKMVFTKQAIYSLNSIRTKIVSSIMQRRQGKRIALRRTSLYGRKPIGNALRNGNIDLVEMDGPFMMWLMDSSDLSYYKSKTYQFDSTSAKEAWIFKYLYLCNLEVPEIYAFCERYMDRQYHVFRTRRTTADRLKRIQYEIDLALARNTFPKNIKNEHKNMEECN